MNQSAKVPPSVLPVPSPVFFVLTNSAFTHAKFCRTTAEPGGHTNADVPRKDKKKQDAQFYKNAEQ